MQFQKNIHTLPVEGHWKFQRGEGSKLPQILKHNMKLNWNFLWFGCGRGQTKMPSMGGWGVWMFSGTAQ